MLCRKYQISRYIRCALVTTTSTPSCHCPRYASPQQLKGAHTAKSDDVWCAGRLPALRFPRDKRSNAVNSILNHPQYDHKMDCKHVYTCILYTPFPNHKFLIGFTILVIIGVHYTRSSIPRVKK